MVKQIDVLTEQMLTSEQKWAKIADIIASPKMVIRDKDGRIVGTAIMPKTIQ